MPVNYITKAIDTFHALIKSKQTGSEDTRYRSWEWCYQAFIDKRSEYENASDEKKKEIVDFLALHLGFYLASWGMYRGSSFLLQRDYKAHIKVVEILLEDQYKSLWGYTPAGSTKGVPGLPNDLIFGSGKLYERIKNAYPNYYKANNDDASDTLITKILMGTMGCVPAFDRFFKRGIKWYQSKGFPFSNELCMTIENKGNNAGKTYGALEEIASKYQGALSISGAPVTYPVMKCLDMFLWQVGFELDLLDNLRQGKNEAKSIETANKLGITSSKVKSVVINDIDNRWKFMNFKVTRRCALGLIEGEDVFRSFDSAKIEFRHIIAEKLGAGIENFTKQIDSYCEEFYPEETPSEMVALKEILTRLATDPNYPSNPDDIELDDFEDDRIEFYADDFSKQLFIYVNDESVKTKFPQAEINVVCMDDPEGEYYFFITDNKSGFDGEHYSTNITLSKED